MVKRAFLMVAFLALEACGANALNSAVESEQPTGTTYEFSNGLWLNKADFKAKTMYVVEGRLRKRRPSRVDEVVNLDGAYVIPPLGEAHTHRPANLARVETDSAFFLDAGVYYVMNQGNIAQYYDALHKAFESVKTPDLAFANGHIVSPQSHSVDLWRRLAARGSFSGVTVETLDGDAYFIVRNEEELSKRWPEIIAAKPDFIKIMVEYSEEYDLRKDDPEYFGQSGLDPSLINDIVSKAHDAGLRVSAHIETAADFHAVVEAGVDLVAHLPGYDIPAGADITRYQISLSDAGLAAKNDIAVVTTTILSVDRADDDLQRLQVMRDNNIRNLELLTDAGVNIVLGSDQFSKNVVEELINLSSLNLYDNATLLDMASRATPQIIFPERDIGILKNGSEADFLVLDGNPIEDIDQIRNIKLRVKGGEILN